MSSKPFSRLTILACALAATLPLFAASAVANELDLNLSPILSVDDSILLAQADAEASTALYAADPRVSQEKSLLSGKRIHQYLGFGSLLFAGLAAVTATDSEGGAQVSSSKKNLHRAMGLTAAALGGAAIANGFYVHQDDFNLDNGWLDPDNMHVLLAIAGTLGYAIAVSTKGKGIHAGAGAGGAALMGLGIVLEW